MNDDDHTRLLAAVNDLSALPHSRQVEWVLLAAALACRGCSDGEVAFNALTPGATVRKVFPTMLDACQQWGRTSMTSRAWGELNHQSRRERTVEARGRVEIQKRAESARMVFAFRLPPPSKAFGWEIRRFGSIVLSRSETEYPTSAEAKVAGEAAMASMHPEQL